MPRPKKCRRVCDFPQTVTFLPEDHKHREQVVILTVDEYETIRLIDKEGLSQEQCGDFMQVARTTVQQIYRRRQKKAGGCAGGRPSSADRRRRLSALQRRQPGLRMHQLL